MEAQTESEIIAPQPGALQITYHSTKILRSETRQQMQTMSTM